MNEVKDPEKSPEKAAAVGVGVQKSPASLNEEQVLQFWRDNDIFQKSLEKPSPEGDFIFYEGPPTANGKPGIHHFIGRAFKDIIPRYKTMRGFHVERKGGWDTHGLPVELQVEKQLGLTSKKDIEAYGVEKFNAECKKSVWEYVDLWERFTERMAYWVDQENPYITYEKTYMESVWNILKTVSEKKADGKSLLYKDYKVLPWCPRCGTALSSHELAQGYEDVKDLSVTIEFRVKGETDRSILAWTTTPWTLPGNVALAVNPNISYIEIEKKDMGDGELVKFILAKDRLESVFGKDEYTIVREMKGSDLIGLEYEPLYPYLTEKFGSKNPEAFAKAYKVYPADFVTTEDGTGIVHTAVMYGQEDFDLGTKIGLPKFHLVQEDGHFIDGMDFLSGRFVKEKDEKGEDATAIDIIKDLAHRGLLFKKEKYAHSYPHCWRCKTPLIYYARDSWYIRMSALRDKLVTENEKVHWQPEHIREGRMGEWLREVKDWAISRERYWGTPLPFWTNEDGELTVIGSVAELKEHIPKRNSYFMMRHGESETNTRDEINSDVHSADPLTAKGREQVKKAAKELGKKNIDVIITSPFMRAKESAGILAQEIGFKGTVVEDVRLSELQVGNWHGKTWREFTSLFKTTKAKFTDHPAEVQSVDGRKAENWEDLRVRLCDFMYDIDARYEGKNILLVGHGGPLNLISYCALGYSVNEIAAHYQDYAFGNAEVRDVDWRALPHNEKFEIDIHKPFIDRVVLVDASGKKLIRVREVLDVWFDSGAMPFAQAHYPFEAKKKDGFLGGMLGDVIGNKQKIAYPADYICEAIDQTRGWFYTLLAIGVLMGHGGPYKNVICLTHILDAQGKKMSKSVGNVVDPWLMMDKYGVDALRLWMFTVNQPGDSKNFDEKTVDEVVKKVFNLLTNVVSFYEMYADEDVAVADPDKDQASPHILDKWIVARLQHTIASGTKALDEFNVFDAARGIRDFVGDLSTWYIRRSRDRFKSDDAIDKARALGTTRYVLRELAKYMAPFTPFYAETLYRKVGGGTKESVHLEDWPRFESSQVAHSADLLQDMEEVRTLVSAAMELRNTAGVKVRQPLSSVTFKSTRLEGREDFLALIADEVNVKEVSFDAALDVPATLDTTISPELKEEGQCREIIRFIQDLRKKENFTPGDRVRLFAHANEAGTSLLKKFEKEISVATLLAEIVYGDGGEMVTGGASGSRGSGETLTLDGYSFEVYLERV